MNHINSNLKHPILVCGINVTYLENGHLHMELFMIATIMTTNTNIRFLPQVIISLGWITGQLTQRPLWYARLLQINGHKSVWNPNITMIQLRKVDLRLTRSLYEISRILSDIKTSLQYMLTLQPQVLKLRFDKQISLFWMQITMYYSALRYARSSLAARISSYKKDAQH